MCDGMAPKDAALTVANERDCVVWPSEVSRARGPMVRNGTLPANPNAMPVRVNGETFASMTDAAHAYGISREAARKRFNSVNFPDWKRL
jgi:hypothetical protein